MLTATETFTKLLKDNRQSVTKARLRVFQALLGQEPLTMQEITKQVRGIDRASVYRTVALFEQLGIAQRINTGWKYRIELTDAFADHHHHLTCVQCGRTILMNESELETLVAKLCEAHHFAPTAHQIEMQGVCQQCQKRAG